MSFKKNFIAKSPDKNAEVMPTIIAHGEIEIATFPLIKSRLSYNAEPMIIGMESKNENVVAACLSMP